MRQYKGQQMLFVNPIINLDVDPNFIVFNSITQKLIVFNAITQKL